MTCSTSPHSSGQPGRPAREGLWEASAAVDAHTGASCTFSQVGYISAPSVLGMGEGEFWSRSHPPHITIQR